MKRRLLIAGNWKMNGLQSARAEARAMVEHMGGGTPTDADVLICPPATLLADITRDVEGSGAHTGGQTCHAQPSGAYTGDVSAQMLADVGASYVIVGHSERRAIGETDAHVREQAIAASSAGLTPIVCVGESEAERDQGRAEAVVTDQVAASLPSDAQGATIVVAYEPIWAIGTGRTPTLEDVAAMHAAIRRRLADVFGADAAASARVLYGGSVKPGNAGDILALADVDGALVGGASLKASDFCAIIDARPR